MSVIAECQPGDEFVCLEQFHASPEGAGFSWDASRQFHVGERLRFVEFRRDLNLKDHPNGWLVIFEASDGRRYAATQTYFATEGCWRGLQRFFCEQESKQSVATSTP